ncbi:hypothetical protein ZWY2020_056842 [Hordeum vulgare]|nr:hypothetical protein ZWY2020_056842 [Hordeum vulgare]
MCDFDGTLDHPQCYFHTALTKKDIVTIIRKLTGEPAAKCGQIGLKPFCKINPAPKKGDKFWSRRPKKQAMKSAKPPSKKNKGKGKSAAVEPSEVDESQAGGLSREQAKKRKTSGSNPDATPEPPRKATPTQEDPSQNEPTIQTNPPELPKGSTDVPRSPVVMATADDPDAVVITGFGFSKPAETILSKHTTSPSPSILESGPSKAKLSDYAGSVLTVKAVIGAKEPITSIKKVLGYLSTLPPQIGELTRSAARKGVLTALSRCLAYAPEINLEEVAAGFPQLKDDGSEFVEEDYQKVVKDSRLAATQLAASLDLTKYQAAYDDKNKKISPPTFVVTNLIPRRPKNPFDWETDLASILTDEDDFASLSRCNWVLGDLQIEAGQSSRQNLAE